MDAFLVDKMAYMQLGDGPSFGFCYIPGACGLIESIRKIIPPSGLTRSLYMGYFATQEARKTREAELDEFLAITIEPLISPSNFSFAIVFPVRGFYGLSGMFSANDVLLIDDSELWRTIGNAEKPANQSAEEFLQYILGRGFSIKDGLDETIHIFYHEVKNGTVPCPPSFKKLVNEHFSRWK